VVQGEIYGLGGWGPGSLLIKYALTIAVLRSAYLIVDQTVMGLPYSTSWLFQTPPLGNMCATLISRLIFKFVSTMRHHVARGSE